MGETSAIEWTDATWNPIRGCTRVSEGCRNCYAETLAARFSDPATEKRPAQWGHGLATRTSKGARWTGKIDVAADATFLAPLRWRKPRRIFVNSLSDLFHEAVPDAVIDRVFAVMALTPQHIFQLLTKRPERMLAYLTAPYRGTYWIDLINDLTKDRDDRWMRACAAAGAALHPLPNVWLGVSVEDQAAADARIPLLLQTPAATRFLSCEPLLGQLDLQRWLQRCRAARSDGECIYSRCPQLRDGEPARSGRHCPLDTWPGSRDGEDPDHPLLNWIIAGGESGPGARPMHPDWARSLRDQCAAAGVPFLFKQWGEWAPGDQVLPPLGPDDVLAAHWAEEPIPGPDGEVPYPMAFRCGKKRAGNLLDGQQHLAWPA